MSEPNIAELRELLARGTLPWSRFPTTPAGYEAAVLGRDRIIVADVFDERHAALIVAAINALPALLDRIAELDKRVEDLRVSRGGAIRKASERAWMGGEAAGRRDSQTRIEELEKALREIRAEGLHSNGTNDRKWYAETARAALDSAVKEWRTGK